MTRNKLSRQSLVIIFGLIVILILVFLIIRYQESAIKEEEIKTNNIPNMPESQTLEPVVAVNPVEVDIYHAPVPANITVPELNATLTKEQAKVIAVPTVVTPVAAESSANYRSFDIRGEGGLFVPSQIIAHRGDIVHVNLTAVDKDYDIVFPSNNMKGAVKKGETKVLEFQALFEGSFTYYCEICGGPKGPTVGKFIIVN